MSKHKNILVLTQWSFKDPLVQAYTLPYVKIISEIIPKGSRIYLVTFEQKRLRMSSDEKYKAREDLKKRGIYLIDYSYSKFGPLSIVKWIGNLLHLFTLILMKNMHSIHAWCMTAGALGYVLSVVTGRKLIIDSYEPHAEAMVENKTWNKSQMKFKVLFYFERKLSRRAETVISVATGMDEYAFRTYGVKVNRQFIKPACVDLDKFNLSKRKNRTILNELGLDDKVVCVYAGKFGGIYLTDESFRFFREAEKTWQERFRVLLLTPHSSEEINKLAMSGGFGIDKIIVRFVPHEKIQDYMGVGDFAITPVKPIPTKRYCTPIKDGEYWALGLPVVITNNISDDSAIIAKHNAGAVLSGFSDQDFRNAIQKIKELLSEPNDVLSKRINELAHQYRSFSIARKIYEQIYG